MFKMETIQKMFSCGFINVKPSNFNGLFDRAWLVFPPPGRRKRHGGTIADNYIIIKSNMASFHKPFSGRLIYKKIILRLFWHVLFLTCNRQRMTVIVGVGYFVHAILYAAMQIKANLKKPQIKLPSLNPQSFIYLKIQN